MRRPPRDSPTDRRRATARPAPLQTGTNRWATSPRRRVAAAEIAGRRGRSTAHRENGEAAATLVRLPPAEAVSNLRDPGFAQSIRNRKDAGAWRPKTARQRDARSRPAGRAD